MIHRIFSLVVLILSMFINTDSIKFIINPDIQLLLGTIIVAIIIFLDSISGLLLGLSLLVAYLRVYAKKYNININEIITNKNTKDYPNAPLISSYYITPKDLENAQNNIVSNDNYHKEVKGFTTGVYNEAVYGAQGIDKIMPGYTNQFPGESYQPVSHDGGAAKGGQKYVNLNL